MKTTLIDDISGVEPFGRINSFYDDTLPTDTVLVSGVESSNFLNDWEGWSGLDENKTIIILPGNGSVGIFDELLSKHQMVRQIRIKAKRYWEPGANPIAYAQRVFPNGMLLGVSDIVILDDVISSGITCQTIRRINEPWIPNAKWHALTLVCQQATRLKGFHSQFAITRVGSQNRKTPIISLSTLIFNETVRDIFLSRNYALADRNRLVKFLDRVFEMMWSVRGEVC